MAKYAPLNVNANVVTDGEMPIQATVDQKDLKSTLTNIAEDFIVGLELKPTLLDHMPTNSNSDLSHDLRLHTH